MKTCSKCKVSKEDTEFYRFTKRPDGFQSRCKLCANAPENNPKAREYAAAFRQRHLEKRREWDREHKRKLWADNHEQMAARAREWLARNPEKRKAYNIARRVKQETNPEFFKARAREYKAANLVRSRKRVNARYHQDPLFKLRSLLRNRILCALKRTYKSAHTTELLGCPVVWLEVHLESLFKPGMTWANYGPVWHVDHVKPCAAFDLCDPEQQRICFHWTNLQPLFAVENMQKSDKYEPQV